MTVYKTAASIPISNELWEEIDRQRHPWKYPDRRLLPAFDLFPRWTRAITLYREARRRVIDARLVLLNGRQLQDAEDLW